jgi:hypothetical protein
MAFEPQRKMDMAWLINAGAKAQADFSTALADGDLTTLAPFAGEVAQITPRKLSDAQRVGKGHEFATELTEVARMLSMQRTFDCSSVMLGWAMALAMGKVTSTQPNAGLNPTAWSHAFKMRPPTETKHARITTVYEALTADATFKRKLLAIAVNSLTLSGRGQEFVQLVVNAIGSGQTTEDPVALPGAVTSLVYLINGDMKLSVGNTGGALTDISDRMYEWSVGFSQSIDEGNARYPSTGLYAGRFWFGDRKPTLQLKLWLDETSDMWDAFIAGTQKEVKLENNGALFLAGQPETHGFILRFPAVSFALDGINEVDGKLCYTLSAAEDNVQKVTGEEAFEATVRNTTAAYYA